MLQRSAHYGDQRARMEPGCADTEMDQSGEVRVLLGCQLSHLISELGGAPPREGGHHSTDTVLALFVSPSPQNSYVEVLIPLLRRGSYWK